MENYGNFHTQLLSIVEVLANTAVLEICKLVDDGFTYLRLEVSRTQRENLELKNKLRLLEVGAPVPMGSCSEKGHSSEPLLGGKDGETDLPEEKPVVMIKAEQLEEVLTGCIMGEHHQELPASGNEQQSSLAPEEARDVPQVTGSGLVGGPSSREGADFMLGGSSTPAPGCCVASGDSPSKGSKSSEQGAPRRLSSRLLAPRPDGGAEDGSPPLSFQSKKFSSPSRRKRSAPPDGRAKDPTPPWVFSCPLCMKDFSTSKGLTVHQRFRHGPSGGQRIVRPFSCSLCGKRFLRSGSINPHMGLHAGEPNACTQCGRHYSSRWNLVRHQAICTAKLP